MAQALALEAADQAPVEPGSEVEWTLLLRNTGAVVDQYVLEVVGEAESWIELEPAALNLLPGGSAQVRVHLRPPRSPEVPAGDIAFGIRVRSMEDPESSIVEEAVVAVAPFVELAADLIPRSSLGSRHGRHQLAVDNLGNRRVTVEVGAVDPDDLLRFRVDPPTGGIDPGTARFFRLRASPHRRFLRGASKTIPFEVVITPDGGEAIAVQGAMVQNPLLPRWFLRALLFVAGGAALLVTLWLTVLRPTVESTARQAATQVVEEKTERLGEQVAQARQQASQAAAAAEEARAAVRASPSPSASTGTTGPPNADPRTATDFRLVSNVAPAAGRFGTVAYKPPEGKVLWITDLVLQNPRGDSGIVQIRRDDEILFEVGLNNFRDLDYHFIQPLLFTGSDNVVLAVECANPGTTRCTPSAYFAGQATPAPSPTPTP